MGDGQAALNIEPDLPATGWDPSPAVGSSRGEGAIVRCRW